MPNSTKNSNTSIVSPTSRMAFSVAICAFAGAGIGMIVNHWLTGWMAVGGMVGLGLFYLGVGVLNLGSEQPIFEDDSTQNVSQRTASSKNLIGEPVVRPRFNLAIPPESESQMSNTRRDKSDSAS